MTVSGNVEMRLAHFLQTCTTSANLLDYPHNREEFMGLLEDVKQAILEDLPTATVHILDPQNDGTHLLGLVIDPSFEEMPLFKQHQVVMRSLKAHFATSLHALQLKTFSPSSWERNKQQYPVQDS